MKAPPIGDEERSFHHGQIVIDLHVDVILNHRLFGYDITRRHRPWMRRQPLFRHADIPRMLEGGYTSAVLGIHYWPWNSRRAFQEVLRQLAYLERVASSDDRVVLARTSGDIERAKAQGKLALLAGLEGAHLLGGELDHVFEARERGALYLTLAHFSRNAAARPAIGRGADRRQGLTPFGRDLVKILNRAGMLVDVAHVNQRTVLEACQLSDAPVIASHTVATAVHQHPRGASDESIRAIAQTGGVVGIMFAPSFLAGKLDVSLDRAVDHIEHVARLVGPEHAAIGTDFDGWISTIPNDIRDCRDLAWLTQKLLERGFSREEVRGILGNNVLRILRQLRGA